MSGTSARTYLSICLLISALCSLSWSQTAPATNHLLRPRSRPLLLPPSPRLLRSRAHGDHRYHRRQTDLHIVS